MKKVSLLGAFCGLLMLTSCGALRSYVADYSVGLATVESPADAKQQFGETKVVTFDEEGVSKYSLMVLLPSKIIIIINLQFILSIKFPFYVQV